MQENTIPAIERAQHEANEWLNALARELGTDDKQEAYHALRGVLFAIRDRILPEEAVLTEVP